MKTFLFCDDLDRQSKFKKLTDDTKSILTLPANDSEANTLLADNKFDVVFVPAQFDLVSLLVKNPPATIVLHSSNKKINKQMITELLRNHISSRVVELEFNKEPNSKFAEFVKSLEG